MQRSHTLLCQPSTSRRQPGRVLGPRQARLRPAVVGPSTLPGPAAFAPAPLLADGGLGGCGLGTSFFLACGIRASGSLCLHRAHDPGTGCGAAALPLESSVASGSCAHETAPALKAELALAAALPACTNLAVGADPVVAGATCR
jgi:hypothetical protein